MKKIGRYALLAIGLAALAIGAWQQLAPSEPSSSNVRVLTATSDLPAGSIVTAKQLGWAEVPQGLAEAYLRSAPVAGAAMLQTVKTGELVPARAVGASAAIGANVVSIRPVVVPVRSLRVGDVVDVWTTPSALIATRATVLAVSVDEQGYSALAKTIDIAVEPSQVQALLAAQLADQARLAVVRSLSAGDARD